MRYTVAFAPEAMAAIYELDDYIASQASPLTAARYVAALIDYCEGLANFPHRGVARDDVRPGLRITNFRKRVVIAYSVMDGDVFILGVFYGGQDYETLLQDSNDPT